MASSPRYALPPANFHSLRHTYASILVMAAVPLVVVAKNQGHADTQMCERHCAHIAPSCVAETTRATPLPVLF